MSLDISVGLHRTGSQHESWDDEEGHDFITLDVWWGRGSDVDEAITEQVRVSNGLILFSSEDLAAIGKALRKRAREYENSANVIKFALKEAIKKSGGDGLGDDFNDANEAMKAAREDARYARDAAARFEHFARISETLSKEDESTKWDVAAIYSY
jgi:hypothetical protein